LVPWFVDGAETTTVFDDAADEKPSTPSRVRYLRLKSGWLEPSNVNTEVHSQAVTTTANTMARRLELSPRLITDPRDLGGWVAGDGLG